MEARACEKCGTETTEITDGLCNQCQSIHAQTLAPEPSSEPKGPTSLQSLAGEAFGEYELIEEVARGGMGVIYKAAAKLDHPGIVPDYDIGEVNGEAFFAMKFIEGNSQASHHGW